MPTEKNSVEALMKACQRGVTGKGPAIEAANNLLAECYGALGKLVAEVEALRKDAELHVQIQRAAEVLPGAWSIELVVERHAGWVDVFDDDGNKVDFHCHGHLSKSVSDAIELAIAEYKEAQP
ncbi:hypothetical protein NJF44_10420 [Pseudomonas guariconensis]|uniref:hypothetical protein n=1 Tax=Pseudomonas TaxID=286 RepID=UPI002096AEB8|nr:MULTISPECIES: hypothetical protein [Pseudomonas]MCO7515766.1 hypothetical protein [Pseudomonas putida]MCO7605642.1 hypothetical protein [Pseudomonas guariconensis]